MKRLSPIFWPHYLSLCPILHAKATAPEATAFDHFTLGLALTAGRNNWGLISLEDRAMIRAVNIRKDITHRARQAQSEGADDLGVSVHMPIEPSPEEQAAIQRNAPYMSPTFWLDKVLTARTSRNLSIFQPPVRAGGAGTMMSIPVSEYIVSPDTLIAGIKCTEALKADLDKRKEIIDRQIQAGEVNYLPSHPPIAQHTEACGGEQAFYRYGIMLMRATP